MGVLVACLLAACGGSATPAPSSPAIVASGAAASTAAVDAGAALSGAISKLNQGYTFATTVSAGGQVATQASGRWTANTSEFVVTSGGTAITYRTIPPRSWVLQPGQGWAEVNGSVPGGSPLDALKAPTQLSVAGQQGGTLELTATYPAAVLGLAGGASVPVALTIASDGTLTAAYDAPTGGASSKTTISPNPGQGPIAAPSPS